MKNKPEPHYTKAQQPGRRRFERQQQLENMEMSHRSRLYLEIEEAKVRMADDNYPDAPSRDNVLL